MDRVVMSDWLILKYAGHELRVVLVRALSTDFKAFLEALGIGVLDFTDQLLGILYSLLWMSTSESSLNNGLYLLPFRVDLTVYHLIQQNLLLLNELLPLLVAGLCPIQSLIHEVSRLQGNSSTVFGLWWLLNVLIVIVASGLLPLDCTQASFGTVVFISNQKTWWIDPSIALSMVDRLVLLVVSRGYFSVGDLVGQLSYLIPSLCLDVWDVQFVCLDGRVELTLGLRELLVGAIVPAW